MGECQSAMMSLHVFAFGVICLSLASGYGGFADSETSVPEIQDYQEVICGNGTVIDLMEVEEFYWLSPERTDGGWGYPPNTECKLTFKIPARHNFRIHDIYDFDVKGDYEKKWAGGDYVQFTINGKKSAKLCGDGHDLYPWCWEDWCWPNRFMYQGFPDQDMTIEAVFKSGADDVTDENQGYYFSIVLGADLDEWES